VRDEHFQVSQGSVETLFRWGAKNVQIFCRKFIQKTVYQILSESPEFYRRYYEKQFRLIFFRTHCTYIHKQLNIDAKQSKCIPPPPAKVYLVSLWFWPLTSDVGNLFSTHMIIICGKLHWHLFTKYIALRAKFSCLCYDLDLLWKTFSKASTIKRSLVLSKLLIFTIDCSIYYPCFIVAI